MTKVLVADDFPLARDGFAAALARDPSIKVVGFAEDGVDALDKTRALQPDVLLLDLRMPRMSGLMALTQLTAEMPHVRVLVVSDLERDDTVVDAVAAGAAGFISKHITGADRGAHRQRAEGAAPRRRRANGQADQRDALHLAAHRAESPRAHPREDGDR